MTTTENNKDGWTVRKIGKDEWLAQEISKHGWKAQIVTTEKKTFCSVWLAGSEEPYYLERPLPGSTEEECLESIEAFFAKISTPVDLGSLDPLDIGFDLRVTETRVLVPESNSVTVTLPRSKKYPTGRKITGKYFEVRQILQQAGFKV